MPGFFNTAYRRIYRTAFFVARLGVFVVAFLAFASAVVLILTQLNSFRSWALGEGLAALNGQLQGKVEVGDVTGNFLTGLELHDVRLLAAGTTLMQAPIVELTYQLRPIFDQRVVGARAIIHRPVIRIIRNARDSTWNFDRITKPAVDSVKTPFNWDIDVQTLEVIDGLVLVNDRTAPPGVDTAFHRVDFTHLRVEDFNLSAQAHISPTYESIWIQNLAFLAPQPDFKLVELSGQVTVDTTGATLKDVYIETGRSLVKMNGRIDSVNFLGVQKAIRPWEDFPITLSLRSPRISTIEMRRFIDALDFMGGTPAVDLDAHGRFSNVLIDRLRIGLPRTDITLVGRLKNLNRPDSFAIDANTRNATVTYADVMDLLPGLDLPDMRYFGRAEIRSASFSGLPLAFVTTIDATTAIGAARGGARLDFRREEMAYTGDIEVQGFDLAPLTGIPSLKSDLTGRMVASGSGYTPASLAARVRLEAQGSTIAGRHFRLVYFDGSVGDGGFVTADTAIAAWGPGGGGEPSTSPQPSLSAIVSAVTTRPATYVESQLPLTATARSIAASSPSAGIGGWIDYRNTSVPRYDLRVRTRDLNLAEILQDPSYNSSLTLTASMHGTGLQPDDIAGTGRIALAPSMYAGEALPATNADYTLEKNAGGARTLVLNSDIADVRVAGTWSFETLVNSAIKGVNALVEYVSRTGSYRGSSVRLSAPNIGQPIAATYEVTMKDLSRLKPFLNGADIAAIGKLNGEIKGNSRALDISVNGAIETFTFKQGPNDFRLAASQVNIDLRGITPGGITSQTGGTIVVRSDSLVRFGGMTFTVPNVNIEMANGIINVRGATVVNGQISVAVQGAIDVSNPSGYLVSFDTLYLNLPSPAYSWRNVQPVRAVIGDGYVQIDQLVLQRAHHEVMSVKGTLAGSELRDVEIRLERASLSDLAALRRNPEEYYGVNDLGGEINTGVVRLNGTLDNPEIDAQFAIDSVYYSGSRVGSFTADVRYSDKNARGRVILRDVTMGGDTMSTPAVIDIRSLPIDLALAPRDQRMLEGRPIDITVSTNNMPVALIAPFVPGLKFQRGTTDINFSIGGTFPEATYSGSVALQNAWALVEGNNVLYRTNALLSFRDNKLTVERMVVSNDPRELVDSRAEITGSVTFEGLSPKALDLNIDVSRLLVLSDASEAAGTGVFGDLVIRTGTRPLRLNGTMARPYLSGDVTVLNADLQLPEGASPVTSGSVVTYMDYNDWLALTQTAYGPEFEPLPTDSTAAGITHLDSTLTSGSLSEANRSIRQYFDTLRARQPASESGSFVDRMTIDLNLEIDRSITLRMQISPIESLRLVIRQEGRSAHFLMEPGKPADLVGNFVLDEGSEYTYIKRFNATGTVRFRGDVSNPEFAVTARYTGRRFDVDGSSTEYEVRVSIQGTPDRLRYPEFDYTVAGQPSAADPQARFQNALSLLLFGRTAEELRSSRFTSHISSLGTSVVGSTLSSSANAALADAFAGSFVRSFDIEFGETITQARLNFVSQFGKAVFRYGGDVANPTEGVASLEFPLSAFRGPEFLRNVVLQLQREVQSAQSTLRAGGPTSDTETWRLRLQIRITR